MALKVKKKGEGHTHPAASSVSKTILQEDISRLAVNIPDSLHQEIKLYAVTNKTSVKNLVIAALRQYMA